MSDRREIQIASPAVGREEWEALRGPLDRGWLTQGPEVAAFERAFAERHDVRFAVAVNSATSALHLALLALGIGPGDEVVLPAFTWVSTANAVVYCGAEPVLVDVSRNTFNLDPDELGSRLTPRTRAVIAVHLFGLCADVEAIRALLPGGVALVEDAACAAGGAHRGRPAGGLGDCGVFSFHPRKSITTGEGGMLTTSDEALADCVSRLRNHGASVAEEERHRSHQPQRMPDFDELGFNYRMTDLQGAIGRVQLAKLDAIVDERARGAAFYRKELADLEWLRPPGEPSGDRHAWQAFVVYVDPAKAPWSRDEIMLRLQARGIATRPGTHAVHTLGYYRRRYGFAPEDFPAARDCELNGMAIPLHNRMTPDDYARVVGALHDLGG